jgi:hypothetical protein
MAVVARRLNLVSRPVLGFSMLQTRSDEGGTRTVTLSISSALSIRAPRRRPASIAEWVR